MKKLLYFAVVLIVAVACSTSYNTVGFKYQNNPINLFTDSVHDDYFDNILVPYKERLESEMTEIISYSDTSLISYKPESPLGNFVSNLILEFSNKYAIENRLGIDVDFSLINNGGLRTSLPKGEITVRNVFELMPFENELVLLKLTGNQVSELANLIAIRRGEGVSGISFGIRRGMAEAIKIQDRPIELDSTYWMVTNDYIANGGDGMKVLGNASQRIAARAKIRDVIINHLRELKSMNHKVTAKTDGRIYNVE